MCHNVEIVQEKTGYRISLTEPDGMKGIYEIVETWVKRFMENDDFVPVFDTRGHTYTCHVSHIPFVESFCRFRIEKRKEGLRIVS